MFSENTLLTAKEGNEGSFVNWLKELGLGKFIGDYSLPQLVEWGWLTPQSRVVLSKDYFIEWKDFPCIGTGLDLNNYEVESLLWDSSWCIDEQESLWFLHPFFRPDDTCYEYFEFENKNTLPQVPDAFNHPNDHIIIPYADYYFHWQAYALIDVIRSADCIKPILNTPDVEDRAQGIVRIAERVKIRNPSDILTLDHRWGGLAELMTWLSHYRAFRGALSRGANRELKRKGANQLASYFNISAETLELAIKDKLLVLAQSWLTANEQHCIWTLRAWPHLQADIVTAIEWLCYLSGKSFTYYLDLWTCPDRQQRDWAELHKILPFEFFADRQHFLDFAPKYLTMYKNELQPNTEELKYFVDDLQAKNYPFGSFLRAFHQLHDQLVYNPKQKGSLDFRDLRPLDYYSLLAIRAEGCLRYELEQNDALGDAEGLQSYIVKLARLKGISGKVINGFKDKASIYTKLNDMPDNPIAAIMEISFGCWSKKDISFLQAFLCCLLARNYFAHHIYLDSELRRSEESGFMLSGILITVLTLLRSHN